MWKPDCMLTALQQDPFQPDGPIRSVHRAASPVPSGAVPRGTDQPASGAAARRPYGRPRGPTLQAHSPARLNAARQTRGSHVSARAHGTWNGPRRAVVEFFRQRSPRHQPQGISMVSREARSASQRSCVIVWTRRVAPRRDESKSRPRHQTASRISDHRGDMLRESPSTRPESVHRRLM